MTGIPALLLFLLLIVFRCEGSLSFEPITWDTGTLDWFTRNATHPVTLENPGTGGTPDGFLRMGFQPDLTPQSADLVTTNSDRVGDYVHGGVSGVRFDFLGYPHSPQALFFESGDGSVWSFDLPGSAHDWEAQTVSFQSETGWSRLQGSADFSAALEQVTLIGITLTRFDAAETFFYGLDNWQLLDAYAVPEPAGAAMAATLLLSTAALLRRRRRATCPASAATGDAAP